MAVDIFYRLETHNKSAPFVYTGSVANGTVIIYGSTYSKATFTRAEYSKLLKAFVGKQTTLTDVSSWLKAQKPDVEITNIAGYLLAILDRERYVNVDNQSVVFK